ncbi:MAG: hypothetical protein QW176_07725 [Candidatus Bathyarchaeia archaeon]
MNYPLLSAGGRPYFIAPRLIPAGHPGLPQSLVDGHHNVEG